MVYNGYSFQLAKLSATGTPSLQRSDPKRMRLWLVREDIYTYVCNICSIACAHVFAVIVSEANCEHLSVIVFLQYGIVYCVYVPRHMYM